MGRRSLQGQVVVVTGAARGVGELLARKLAARGARLALVGLEPEELEKVARTLPTDSAHWHADVTDHAGMARVAREVRERFGTVDIVVANAGILPMAMGNPDPMGFVDASDVDLVGVMNTVAVAVPHLPDGSSIIVTGSTAGMIRGTTTSPDMGPGGAGYGWSKRVVIEYVEEMSLHLAPKMIRVNAIHPTNCNTHLLQNEGMYGVFRPDLKAEGKTATREDAEPLFSLFQAMPIPYVEPEDMAHLGVFLASDESRYITGQQIRVDAGSLLKWPNGPGG